MKIPGHIEGGGDGPHNPGHDRITSSALDTAIQSDSQSYDQFLQGFVHLTAADVAPSVMQNAFGSGPPPSLLLLQNSRATRAAGGAGGSSSPPLILRPETEERLPSPPLADISSIPLGDDFEEVVDCSDAASSQASREPWTKSLQMDNFVLDEGSDDDLDDLGAGYASSFGPDSSYISTKPCVQGANILQKGQQSESERTISEIDTISGEIKKINLCRPTIPSIISNPQPIHTEESLLDLIAESSKDSDAGEELVYDPSLDRPNPGEVEDVNDVTESGIMTNVREMLYSARFAEPDEIPSSTYTTSNVGEDNRETVIDSVEAFSLDEDFDYDNVILTPKFTPQEQIELDEWARKGREENGGLEQSTS